MTAKPSVDGGEITAIWNECVDLVSSVFGRMEIADDEIRQATQRHPGHADDLYHAIDLLRVQWGSERPEFVYRSHCRELLERVAAGGDTRPPTNAELAIVCCETSLQAPLTPAGMAVYLRVWAKAFPDGPLAYGDDEAGDEHWEHVAGYGADEHERAMRRRFAVPDRRLGDVECGGWHHGQRTETCRFWRPTQTSLFGPGGERPVKTRTRRKVS